MASDALADNTFAVVLAGGNGTRLDPLTRHVCKPALPFGGAFRSIDFTLANCVNSGVRTIGVATQYKPAALLAHLAGAWNGALGGSVVVPWPAHTRAPNGGYGGTADAVYRNLDLIDEVDPRLVLVLAGDHVYRMDYRPMLEEHCARGADVTVGCVEVAVEEARHFGILAVGDDGRIEHFVEKPQSKAELPRTGDDVVPASMGIYVFGADFLARALTRDALTPGSRHDFGTDIFPKLIGNARLFAHAFRARNGSTAAYWRDIGTLRAYWQAHMDLLGSRPLLALDETTWPVGTVAETPQRISAATVTTSGGTLEDSIVGPGCAVAGQVRHSVLFAAVEIGRGATVVDSVVLPGARVGSGSRLCGVIVDADCRVSEGTVVGPAAPCAEPLVLTRDAAREETIRYALTG
jgi:glucose-1-phosphate adenylyltransferase